MKQIGEDMMIRVMQYCDGALQPDEARVVAAEIAACPELQQLEADLRQGATLAREAFSGVANDPLPLQLVRSIAQAANGKPEVAHHRPGIFSFLPRDVAAAIVGIVCGAAAISLWLAGSPAEDGLRLAGLPESATTGTYSATFKAALMDVLKEPGSLQARKYAIDSATGNEAEISVVAWFNLADGSRCAEIQHVTPIDGIARGVACENADMAWDVLLRPSAE